MFIDSHCHLAFPEYEGRMDAVRDAMATSRVHAALVICTTLEEFDRVHAVAAGFDNFWATVGVHPDNEGVQEPTLHDLTSRAVHPKVIAVGETGLDYYRLGTRSIADMAWQRDRFAVHIQAARATQLPLVVHTRSASDDTLAVLKHEGQGMVRGVFHCFTETQAVARAALDLGFDISFSGILTFKNAADLRDVAKLVPMDRLLIETDSPFLAPMPHRGKTNQPAFVALVAEQVAQIKGLPLADVASQTTRNFERLFGVMVPVPHAAA
jgi:TatD DNase family protein